MPNAIDLSTCSLLTIAMSLLVGCSDLIADASPVTVDAVRPNGIEAEASADDPEALLQLDSLTADEILKVVARTYQAAETIRMGGSVTTQRGEQRPKVMGLELLYRRPDLFRFNYQAGRDNQRNRCLAYFDETELRFFTDESKTALFVPWDGEFANPILNMLSGIQSATNLLPYVPYLLLYDDPLSAHLMQFENFERLPNENKGDVPCFRIRGNLTGALARTVTIWVSAHEFTVEQIVEHLEEDGESVEITTNLIPVMNAPIEASHFMWDPPEGVMERRYDPRESAGLRY